MTVFNMWLITNAPMIGFFSALVGVLGAIAGVTVTSLITLHGIREKSEAANTANLIAIAAIKQKDV